MHRGLRPNAKYVYRALFKRPGAEGRACGFYQTVGAARRALGSAPGTIQRAPLVWEDIE